MPCHGLRHKPPQSFLVALLRKRHTLRGEMDYLYDVSQVGAEFVDKLVLGAPRQQETYSERGGEKQREENEHACLKTHL